MRVTKREVIVSVAIICVMLTIGFFISSCIESKHLDKVQVYNTALTINKKDLFEYGMKTNAGNAFVFGHLRVVDPVSYDEVGGLYWYIRKTTEKYTKHTRTVSYRDSKGNLRTRTEDYWSWDTVKVEDRCCKRVEFLGIEFSNVKFEMPPKHYIDTVGAGYHKRYVFYGVCTDFDGTIFTKLNNNNISNGSPFYECGIEEAKHILVGFNPCVVFLVAWIVFTCLLVLMFYWFNNDWLE